MADEDYEMVEQPDADEVQSAQSGHSNEEYNEDMNDDDLNNNGYNEYDDDLNEDDDNYPKPQLKGRVSFQRPKQEKKINKQDFKKYRGLIKKRLSEKQRMPFEQLVVRNIHAGFEDELYEKKPMEKSKKILQLNRRLSHRPHPNEIQNDDELPPDLKKADSEYYKLYKYRAATERDLDLFDDDDEIKPPRTRTSSDPNPPNKPVQKIIKPSNGAQGFSSIDNPLDWKFGQRSSTKELQIRGIIPEQYADVVHGNKSLEQAKEEWEAYKRQSLMKIKNKVDLKFRPSKKDLKDRGIVPDWENPEASYDDLKNQQEKNKEALAIKYKQRMDPKEAHDRAIIDQNQLFSHKDYDELKKEEIEKKKALKLKMQSSINQRSDKSEVVFRGIVPQEYLEDDAEIAKAKVKEQRTSIKMTLSDKFANRKNPQQLTNLLLQTTESNPVPQPFQPPISNGNGNTLDSTFGGYSGALPTTPEYDEIDDPNIDDDNNYDFPTFLDRLKAEKEQTSKTLELHMRRRSTMEDLQKQGILPMPNPRAQSSGDYDADGDQSNEDIPELQDRAATQQDRDDDDDDNNDNNDNNDNDEMEDGQFVSFIDRLNAERKKHRKSLKEMHRRRPSKEDLIAKGIWKEAQVYMSDEYANSLNKRRGSRDDGIDGINNDNEDSQDDMPEEDIVSTSSEDDSHDEYPTFLDRMREEKEQFKQQLETKHRRRPSQQDLEDRGVVEKGYFDNMQVALTNKRKRRKSFTTELANFFQQRPDIAEMLTKGLVAAEFIGMDALEMANKRKAIKSTLNRKLNKKRRPTMDDLEMRGIVPAGYFSDAGEAMLKYYQRRDTLTQKLHSRLKDRATKTSLEQRNIVPFGYFQDAQKAVSTKHTRRMTAEKDLTNFLPKRMNPKKMLEKGLIPKQHFQNIMGMTIPIPTMVQVSPEMFPDHQVQVEIPESEEDESDDDEINQNGVTKGGDNSDQYTMSKQQQAFSAGTMGVASIYAQKLVKQTIESSAPQQQITRTGPIIEEIEAHHTEVDSDSLLQAPNKSRRDGKRDSMKRVSTAIENIVLDIPQHAERHIFDHDNWTQNLYESLLNSLRFGQIQQRIKKETTDDNYTNLASILEKYQAFERMHHTKMNGLQRDKKIILDQIQECEKKENEAMEVLKNLVTEHAALEQKIRPQMKMLLHKMTLVESRILRLDKKGQNISQQEINLKEEYEKELNYYDTYITELKNVFIHTNNIRSKYQNIVRTVITHKSKLETKLNSKDQEIETCKKELNTKFDEFHKAISSVTNNKNDKNDIQKEKLQNFESEQKYDPLASDPITDLPKVLDEKNKNLDNNLDLLSFRISTIPATDYALRVIELCQLSYIYSNENLKEFFEWFIRFAVRAFIEINYAHTCFVTQNRNAIDQELSTLNSIKFIANLTPTPDENKIAFDKALYEQLTVIVSYLELLPSNNDADINDDYSMSNNNIDHEYVIFHVARYLTADFTFSQEIRSCKDEYDIPRIAQTKVDEWIKCILQSTQSSFIFSNDYNEIKNKHRPRNIIKSLKEDSTARVRPARAAAIVMDHVYGIHVHG